TASGHCVHAGAGHGNAERADPASEEHGAPADRGRLGAEECIGHRVLWHRNVSPSRVELTGACGTQAASPPPAAAAAPAARVLRPSDSVRTPPLCCPLLRWGAGPCPAQ